MSKFIKKELRRTLPVIVIFCIINVLVLGLSFNLNLNFVQPAQKGFVKLAPAADAASTATTSVIVLNSPPIFTTNPAENPFSTSTSPINVGANIGFTGTAMDPEGDSYWLLICSGNKAATSTGGYDVPPTCSNGTMFCRSNIASSTVAVSCTYNGVTDPGSETQAWYGFACDNHLGDARCSPLNQGTGNSGSPFYVNHSPHLNHLYTSINNRNPGQTVTITASTTDYDHASGYNVQNFYVCSTNSWTVGGGCGGTEYCHGSSSAPSTASSSVSCNYTIPIPKDHTSYSYYGFLKDVYKMPASIGQGTSSTYTVNNVAPVVSSVTLNSGNNISLNIKGAPQIKVYASSTSVTDNNGCTDLSSATSTIYLSTYTNNCAANNSNCYQIAAGNCGIYNCSGPTSVTATVKCSTTLAFFTMPTDAFSKASTSSWFAGIKVADSLGLRGLGIYNTLNGVEVVSDNALSVNEVSIPYGTVQAGTNTGANNAVTTVVNYGNTPIDTAVSGTDMLKNKVGPEKIKVTYQQHSKNAFSFTAGNTSSTTPDTVTVGIARPLDFTDVTGPIYWGIFVPIGVPSASFFGVNTFTSVPNKYDNWNYP